MVDVYGGRWECIENLGSGGQGEVFKVRDKNVFQKRKDELSKALRQAVSSVDYQGSRDTHLEQLFDLIKQIVDSGRAENAAALKVIHDPQDARDPARARQRIDQEIGVMSQHLHPQLLSIVDHGEESDGRKWYVSPFLSGGTLDEQRDLFKGDALSALRAFRPIVEAVSVLHNHNCVHRDIKPQNIFLDESRNLILGDFGLVYRESDGSRVSATFENVGSRDWMPGWAHGIKLEEVTPSFDVFSLGKVLWSMVSGLPVLQLWYFDRPNNDLTHIFPHDSNMRLLNSVLGKCIVQDEEDCLPNGGLLLGEVDALIYKLELGVEELTGDFARECRVCGDGKYSAVVDRDRMELINFGIKPVGTREFKVFACDNCGHVQFFFFNEGEENLPAWES